MRGPGLDAARAGRGVGVGIGGEERYRSAAGEQRDEESGATQVELSLGHAGRLDDAAETRALLIDELLERRARAADRLDAHVLEALDGRRILHRRVDRRCHLVDDRLRRAARRMHAGPVGDANFRETFLGGGRQLRIGGDALGPGGRQRLQLAALQVGQDDDAGLGGRVDLAAEHRGDRLGAALVGHEVEPGAVLGDEQPLDEVRRAAGARGREVQAGAFLRRGDELLDIVVGRLGRHDDHRRRQADHRHRHQVVLLVGQALSDHAVRQQAGRADQERIAIGRGLGDEIVAEHGAAAGPVVHDDRLAQRLASAFGGGAAEQVVGAAGGEGNDEVDRPGRPGLSICAGAEQGTGEAEQGEAKGMDAHAKSPFSFSAFTSEAALSAGCRETGGSATIAPRAGPSHRHASSMQPPRHDSHGHAECARLRGMPGDGRHLGAPASVPQLRPRRLLRRLEEPARHQALQGNAASDHRGLRPARRLGLVLRRRGHPRSVGSKDTAQRADPALLLTFCHLPAAWPGLSPCARARSRRR